MKLLLTIVACSIFYFPDSTFSKSYAEKFLKNRKEIAEKNKVKYDEEKPFDLSKYDVGKILENIPTRNLNDINKVEFGLALIVDEDKDHVDDYIENIISEFKDRKVIELILNFSIIYNHSYKTCSSDVDSDECLYQLALYKSLRECLFKKLEYNDFVKVRDLYSKRKVVSELVARALSKRNIYHSIKQLRYVKNYDKYYSCLNEEE